MSKVLFFGLLGYFVMLYDEFQVIIAGIAIFTIGVYFVEEGFRKYIGLILEKSVRNSRRKTFKSFIGGAISSMIVQSSLLINMILLTFLSTRTVSLVQAFAIIVGSFIGTTFTAWMILFLIDTIPLMGFAVIFLISGLVIRFIRTGNFASIGNILLGSAFLFLGLDYMDGGFKLLESEFDIVSLSHIHLISNNIPKELAMFIIGIITTILVQSSSATMGLTVVATFSGSMIFVDAITFAMGISLGRIFVMIFGTASVSSRYTYRLIFYYLIYGLILSTVSYLVYKFFVIKQENIDFIHFEPALLLAIFYSSIAFVSGIILLQFNGIIAKFLLLHVKNNSNSQAYDEVLYLETNLFKIPATILASVRKEEKRFYENVLTYMSHVLLTNKEKFKKYEKHNRENSELNIASKNITKEEFEEFFIRAIFEFSKKIEEFINEAQKYVKNKDSHRLNDIKATNQEVVKVLSDISNFHKHLLNYDKNNNQYIKSEYFYLRDQTIYVIYQLYINRKLNRSFAEIVTELEVLKDEIKNIDVISTGRLNELIKNGHIDTEIATSLINDSINIHNLLKALIDFHYALWVEDDILREKLSNLVQDISISES